MSAYHSSHMKTHLHLRTAWTAVPGLTLLLAVDDVILGAMAGSSGTVPPFNKLRKGSITCLRDL
jgi:hypothetical protein